MFLTSETVYSLIRVIDTKHMPGAPAECDRCGRVLRYVHVVEDAEGNAAEVGRCCAERLIEDYDGGREERLATRRARFVATGWKKSAAGNDCRKYRGWRIVIFPATFKPDHFSFVVIKKTDELFSQGAYDTRDGAKEAAFNVLLAHDPG